MVPWLFSPVEVPQILVINSVEDTPVWQQRQVPWRFSPVEVPQILRGRLHSPVSGGAFSSGQSIRLLTGARAESYDQIVDVPTLQIQVRV